jgi:hypothetical protein
VANFGPLAIFQLGKNQTEAMLNLQKEMMAAYRSVVRRPPNGRTGAHQEQRLRRSAKFAVLRPG